MFLDFREKYPWKWNVLESNAESDQIFLTGRPNSTFLVDFSVFFERAMWVSKHPFEMSAKVDRRDARAFLRRVRNVSSGFKSATRTVFCALVRSFASDNVNTTWPNYLKKERKREKRRAVKSWNIWEYPKSCKHFLCTDCAYHVCRKVAKV